MSEKYGWRLIEIALRLIEDGAHEGEILNASCFLFAYLGVKMRVNPENLLRMITLRVGAILDAQGGSFVVDETGEA